MATPMEDLLAKTPEHMRKGLEDLLNSTRETREQYGYEVPEGEIPAPLSLAEMKEGEIRNATTLIAETIAHHRGKRDLDNWVEVWHSRVTHNRDLPAFAMHTIAADCWTPDEARTLAEASWTMPEWPGQYDRQDWFQVFNEVGFICSVVEDGGTCQWHPAEDAVGSDTVQVWRGALSSAKRGMSWTTDRDRALWFVRRGDMSGKGRKMRLWTAQAEPERVLAHFHRRSEDEFVLDPTRMKITEEQL
jgi:hypothetical protein